MKKLALLMMGVAFIASGIQAQVAPSPLAEGVKMLNYEKNKSALDFFKAALDKSPTDPELIFWYGQAVMAQNYNGIPTAESIQKTKVLYQSALQAKGNDAWLLVGMAHIQSLEGADAALIKNNLELALTSSKVEKGKNKGKNNPEIINAIGRVYAELPISIGDHHYAIDKLKDLISSYDEATIKPDLFLNLGINYLKLGGENGGEAVSAFSKALDRDPKCAYANYRIGKIYQSQNNKESLEDYYNKALAIDPAIAPVYVSLYTFYARIDTTKARKNLDLFLQYSDKDPAFDYLYADYLFQVGQYDASLAKAQSLEKSIGIETYPRIAVLLAYNYTRTGDSLSAKKYIEPFINNTPIDKILPDDYDLAVKVLSKFPGNQSSVATILEKAIAADSSNKKNAMKLYRLGYEMFEKASMYSEASKWFAKYSVVRGVKDETYYYKTASIAINANDGVTAAAAAKEYIAAFPDKTNGYLYNVKAAKLLDTANNLGILFEAINTQNVFLLKDVEKNKQTLVNNYYSLIGYYNETKAYENAALMCDKVLELVPNDPNTLGAKAQFEKNIKIMKEREKGGAKPTAPKTDAAASSTPPKN
jgi:tetratricopeptide (TPR) repeat protein